MDTTIEHKLTRAGLGNAPFRFLGVTENMWSPCTGVPAKPGGCCAYCSTGIRFEYVIESADGKRSTLGCECIRHAGDKRLTSAMDKARRRLERSKRHAREAERVAAIRAHLDRKDVRAELAAQPHPSEWRRNQGESLLDAIEWRWKQSGASGKIKLGKELGA